MQLVVDPWTLGDEAMCFPLFQIFLAHHMSCGIAPLARKAISGRTMPSSRVWRGKLTTMKILNLTYSSFHLRWLFHGLLPGRPGLFGSLRPRRARRRCGVHQLGRVGPQEAACPLRILAGRCRPSPAVRGRTGPMSVSARYNGRSPTRTEKRRSGVRLSPFHKELELR